MTVEELLLAGWRSLPLNKQQAVIDFTKFLKTISCGPLLNWEGIEREQARQGEFP